MNRSLSILIHADSKVGKTTLAATAPAPRLLLDVEAASRFLPGRQIRWDPMKDAPPVPDGTWDTCVVLFQKYAMFDVVKRWLISGQHGFRSVIIDSITEFQVRCKEDIQTGNAEMDYKNWGRLLDSMERDVRDVRDLTEHPTKPLEAVVITAMTYEKNGKWKAYVQGQLATKLPYFFDVIAYMHIEDVYPAGDFTSAPIKMRKLVTQPEKTIEAGTRSDGIPPVLDLPKGDNTVPRLLDMVFGVQQEEGVKNV